MHAVPELSHNEIRQRVLGIAKRAGRLLKDARGTEARCRLFLGILAVHIGTSFALQDSAKPVRPGETIYKGHHSYDLMRNLQLGIIFSTAKSVEQSTGGGFKDPVKDEDFTQQVRPRTHSCPPAYLCYTCFSGVLCLSRDNSTVAATKEITAAIEL